jgi:hypothetical protein
MQPQSPASNILKMSEFKDSTSYRIECNCATPQHGVYMWVEVDREEEFKQVNLAFIVETTTRDSCKKTFNRFKAAWDLLTKGYHTSEAYLILDEQSAINVANTILTDVEKFRDK